MTTIRQIADSYQLMLAEARRTGKTPQQHVESIQAGILQGTDEAAKADFRVLQLAVQRQPFNQAGGVEAYMNAVIAAAQNPTVANQPFTLDSLDSARVFSGAPRVDAPAPQPANVVQPVNTNTNPPAPPVAPVPQALNMAVTNFLTGGATTTEITALKGAVNVADSNPPGQLHGRGGVNGAETLEATRRALGGPLSATNHPELYTLARARYFEITGLDPNTAPTEAQIDAAEAKIRNLPPEQIAEYQSVAYLLGQNEEKLSNNKINVDGVYGRRTDASVGSANTALRPTSAPTEQTADASADAAAADTSTTPARPRVVVLDMSIEDSRGDRERLLSDVQTELARQLNTDPARPIRVEVFNPRDNRDGPQTLTQFMQAQGANADIVGVMSLKNDGIRGTDNDLRLTFTGRANNVPAVEMTITDRGMREGMTPAITAAATEMKGLIDGTTTRTSGERTFDIVSPQQARVLEASL